MIRARSLELLHAGGIFYSVLDQRSSSDGKEAFNTYHCDCGASYWLSVEEISLLFSLRIVIIKCEKCGKQIDKLRVNERV